MEVAAKVYVQQIKLNFSLTQVITYNGPLRRLEAIALGLEAFALKSEAIALI